MQFLLHHCCVTSSKLLILSVGFLLSICWIAVQPSRHMNHHFLHEDFPVTSVENELFLFFPPRVTSLSWTPATCQSLCLRWWPCCWSTGKRYPALTVLLVSCSSPSLVPLPATSWPSWPVTAVWLCANHCFMSPLWHRRFFWFCDGLTLMVSSVPWWWIVSFSQVFVIILPVLPLWCWCNCASLQFIVDLLSFQ